MPKPTLPPPHRFWSTVAMTVGLVILVAAVLPLLVIQRGARIPEAPANLQGRPTNLVLALDSQGTPSINNQVVPWERLDAELEAIYSRRPEKILFLKANPQNDYRTVVRAAEIARRHSVTVYLLPWEPR